MHETDLVLIFTERVGALGLRYMVTGSVASTLYGEPRLTHDVDLVIELAPERAAELAAAFPAREFYAPPAEVMRVEAARRQRGHFNLIHLATGFKADVYLAGEDALHQWAMGRVRQFDLEGGSLSVAPAEYVIVRKLEFFREGKSEKHLRDIRRMLEVTGQGIDRGEVERWVERLGLQEEWRRAHGQDCR